MIYLNGHFINSNTADFDLRDRGLLLADGLFETLRCEQGKPLHLYKHWQRLANGCAKLSISNPIHCNEANTIIKKLLQDNELTDCPASARLTLTRGPGPRGLTPPTHPSTTLLITCEPAATLPMPPLSLCATPYVRNEHSPTSAIKSLCYLDHILARQYAISNGYDDGTLSNTRGQVVCASHANLFIIKKDQLRTPQPSSGALAGITRQIVLELARTFINCEQTELYAHDLMTADEMFITNAIIGIVPVKRYENVSFQLDTHSYTSRLQMALRQSARDSQN